jgi:hypothetical protein
MRNKTAFALFLVVIALAVPGRPFPAWAADPAPGDACPTDGQVMDTGGAESAGVGNMMVCEGGTWKVVVGFNGSGQITKLGNQTCTTGQVLSFDGTKWACGSGGGGGMSATAFGSWQSKAAATVTQADSDGFVVAYVTNSNGTSQSITGYTDSNASPTTKRCADRAVASSGYFASCTFPVKSGDYWKVTVSGGTGTVYWMPIVTAYAPGGTTNPVFTAANGWFILSHDTWNGNLGGLSGADSKCLSDLTTYDWKGKSDAQSFGVLNSTHVFAWLCDTGTCRNVTASKKYYFAASGDTSAGGTYFTPDSGGYFGYVDLGGGDFGSDGVQYSALSTFNANTQYWTNRDNDGNAAFLNSADTSASGTCTSWSSASNTRYGIHGASTAADGNRWWADSVECSNVMHLICIVNP